MAPAGTPGAVVNRLNAVLNTVLREPEMREQLAREAAIPVPGTADAFGALIKAEVARWASIVIGPERKVE